MAFKKWVNVPEVMQEVEKLSAQAEEYNALLAAKKTEDEVAAQKIRQSMAASYWDILFATVEANTKSNLNRILPSATHKVFIGMFKTRPDE